MGKIDYSVRCTDPQRKDREAKYKIAAEWTGGGVIELKTFGFADDECLPRVFAAAEARAAKIRLTEGERLSRLQIYRLDPLRHDYELERAPELEESIAQQKGS